MTEELNEMHYFYVGVDDGEHFHMFEENNSLFEATCIYYQTIHEGHEDQWEWVELGEWIECDDEPGFPEMITLKDHVFKEIMEQNGY